MKELEVGFESYIAMDLNLVIGLDYEFRFGVEGGGRLMREIDPSGSDADRVMSAEWLIQYQPTAKVFRKWIHIAIASPKLQEGGDFSCMKWSARSLSPQ